MNRFITMFRGGMVTLIYSRALLLKDGVYEESAAVSLMSNDVDQISDCLEELNEVWSRTIEIGIGLPLLTLQLGWVSIIPLLVVFSEWTNFLHFRWLIISSLRWWSFSGRKSHWRSSKLWADATQKRLAITSSMLREMSSLKMMGLDEVVGENVQAERVAETKRLESWAWIKIWQNVIGA
jgi:ATP-binding cassette subfamily C (CFTR/MRP) protein 1